MPVILKRIIQTDRSSLMACRCVQTDAGRPNGSEPAPAAAHDDGTDALAVHLHLQSPHSVPEKLQTDLSAAFPPSHDPLWARESRLEPERIRARLEKRGKYEGRCTALHFVTVLFTRMSVPALLLRCT